MTHLLGMYMNTPFLFRMRVVLPAHLADKRLRSWATNYMLSIAPSGPDWRPWPFLVNGQYIPHLMTSEDSPLMAMSPVPYESGKFSHFYSAEVFEGILPLPESMRVPVKSQEVRTLDMFLLWHGTTIRRHQSSKGINQLLICAPSFEYWQITRQYILDAQFM